MGQITQKEIYKHYLAMDWSQETVSLAAMLDTGTEIRVMRFDPNPRSIKNYLKSLPGRKILTVEETTTSHWLYVELKESVDRILVCDPYRNALLKDGPKNDDRDASQLCWLLRKGMLKEVFHSMDKLYEIRKLVSSYEDFVNASVRFKNQRAALFRAVGKDHKEHQGIRGSEINNFINQKQLEIIQAIADIREEFEKKYREIAKSTPLIRQLMKIAGIGLKTAVTIYSIVIDANRFVNKYKYWAYCGLARYQKDSGNKNYGSRPIRHSKLLKRSYKTATIASIAGNNDIREYYEHLLQNGYSFREARSQITRYIAKVSYAVMKNKTDYQPYQWRKKK